MIERDEIDGKPCTIAYLTRELEPATRDKHDLMKIIFDDGPSLFAVADDDDEADDMWRSPRQGKTWRSPRMDGADRAYDAIVSTVVNDVRRLDHAVNSLMRPRPPSG